MKTALDRPTRPAPLDAGTAPTFDLEALAGELLAEAATRSSERSAVTLVSHPGLTTVLTGIRAGGALSEHRAPGPTSITCVLGRVVFETEHGAEELPAGSSISFPPGAVHAVHAEEDSAILIVIGGTEG